MKFGNLFKRNFGKQWCYAIVLLLFLNHPGYSQSRNVVQPIIDIAPLWIMSNYGLYWGVSISGGIEIKEHHKLVLSADLAPLGILAMSDVSTKGKIQHWGGTFSYLFKIELAKKLIRFEPGATLGLSSIPYLYGTYTPYYIDTTLSTISTTDEKPERENIWVLGPELRISLGRKRIQFFVDGRLLFAKDFNIALLTNLGLSVKL